MANGLITKNTDLKSLKYGSMPLGSDKPYVTKNIGQAPGSQIGAEISHRIDDVSRIAKMLVDKPGIKYLLNEALLQQVNVGQRIKKAQQGGKSLVGAVLQQAGSTLLTTVKIVGSTLAQVPVNGTGTHFLKGFRTDTYLRPGANEKIPGAFASFFGAGGVEGAPYALRGEIVPTNVETQLLNRNASGFDYLGDVYVDRNEIANPAFPVSGSNKRQSKLNAESGTPITVIPSGSQAQDTTASITGSTSNRLLEIVNPTDNTDKFENVSSETNKYYAKLSDVNSKNGNITKESRVRLGDQGAKGSKEKQAARKTNSYWFKSNTPLQETAEVDKINALFPNDGKILGTGKNYQEQVLNGGQTLGRDLIKFRFHILTANGKEKVLYLRAFLDSFADNYSGQWNPVKYLGRAEDFQIYSGFQRKISLSFKIAAATRLEMRPIYEKMIWLASATAPTYANEGQFMRGTITKITVGDYIYELPGVLNSVNYTWNTEYPWEIAMTQPENLGKDDFEQELPMVMDCSIDFTPIHTFTPTTGLRPYITPATANGEVRGILKGIDNEKTGLEPTPAIAATALVAPPALLTAPTFGPQLA